MEYVTYEQFKKMDMRIGTIRAIEPVEGADKLLRCQIDFGTKLVPIDAPAEIMAAPADGEQAEAPAALATQEVSDIRQIVSGIREFFPEYEKLVGKQVLYVVNLEPRTIRGVESHGMLMAVDGKDGNPIFLVPEVEVSPGSKVR